MLVFVLLASATLDLALFMPFSIAPAEAVTTAAAALLFERQSAGKLSELDEKAKLPQLLQGCTQLLERKISSPFSAPFSVGVKLSPFSTSPSPSSLNDSIYMKANMAFKSVIGVRQETKSQLYLLSVCPFVRLPLPPVQRQP